MSERSVVYQSPYRNIVIPIRDGNVAVSFSGGADCTILVYVLLMHGVVPVLLHENESLPKHVIGLAYHLAQQFGVNLRVEWIKLDPLRVRYGIFDAMEDFDCLYSGVTQNPPAAIIDWGPRRPLTAMDGKYEKIVSPFVTFDKRAPMWLYSLLGEQALLDQTQSCADGEPSCGECFHCIERKWATHEVQRDFAEWREKGKA